MKFEKLDQLLRGNRGPVRDEETEHAVPQGWYPSEAERERQHQLRKVVQEEHKARDEGAKSELDRAELRRKWLEERQAIMARRYEAKRQAEIKGLPYAIEEPLPVEPPLWWIQKMKPEGIVRQQTTTLPRDAKPEFTKGGVHYPRPIVTNEILDLGPSPEETFAKEAGPAPAPKPQSPPQLEGESPEEYFERVAREAENDE